MWFYFYLLSTSFFDEMGFQMYGFTTNSFFSHAKMIQRIQTIYPTIHYTSIYKIPNQYNNIGVQIDKLIRPPFYQLVRDDYGFAWYRISEITIEKMLSNASIPFQKIEKTTKRSKEDL